MIVDTSVLVAILAKEPERRDFVGALSGRAAVRIAGGSWMELATVLVRRFGVADPLPVLARLRDEFALAIVTTTVEQAHLGIIGYARYGKGAGHRARLNFGDCFSYALARATGEPLLFKGDDFNHTDLTLSPAAAYPR